MYYRYWTNEYIRPAHFGIRNHRYKLAMFYGQARNADEKIDMPFEPGWEFYDLQNDPNELHNAIADPEYISVIDEMKEELIRLRDEYEDNDSEDTVINEILNEKWGK